MRRYFGKMFFLMTAMGLLNLPLNGAETDEMTPQKAIKMLSEGNSRFINNQSKCPNRATERVKELAQQQNPFAVIVGCSDSRVSPEIVFDQGIGDLFIVRTAGNVVGPIELASIEYSAIVLKSSLIVVLGHENCGAVKAVIDGQSQAIAPVADLIKPAIAGIDLKSTNGVEEAIKANVKSVMEQLKQSSALKELIEKNKLNVVGGYYNFHSGTVEKVGAWETEVR